MKRDKQVDWNPFDLLQPASLYHRSIPNAVGTYLKVLDAYIKLYYIVLHKYITPNNKLC